jgi:hypothetical protein
MPGNGVEYIERYWSLADFIVIAKKNVYYNDDFRAMFDTWKIQKYYYDGDRSRVSIENYYSFYAKWNTRLDFNGTKQF